MNREETYAYVKAQEYHRLMTTQEGVRELLQGGDDTVEVVDDDSCHVIAEMMRERPNLRTHREHRLWQILHTLADRLAHDRADGTPPMLHWLEEMQAESRDDIDSLERTDEMPRWLCPQAD